ncbi:FMN-binding protein [Cellulomonas sp. URHD0024]|uniref:FMN-binding protein n=1 Tax=Cellulomonas sp. URHD0024 TaxID=1302620 RepID=UPI0003F5B4B5|nr:FMN-binding protein [Cellulomonas sp. URHD0024]
MSARPWRGTLLFVGAAAAMTAAGMAKFAPVMQDTTAPATAGTTSNGSVDGTTDHGTTNNGSTASGSDPASTDNGSSTTSDTVTIVGSVERNRYGSVQVSVTFVGSQITDVQTLQVPDRERESVRINENAAPALAQEVLAAQSSHIDTVSGATYTSESYAASVQSAIDQHG